MISLTLKPTVDASVSDFLEIKNYKLIFIFSKAPKICLLCMNRSATDLPKIILKSILFATSNTLIGLTVALLFDITSKLYDSC